MKIFETLKLVITLSQNPLLFFSNNLKKKKQCFSNLFSRHKKKKKRKRMTSRFWQKVNADISSLPASELYITSTSTNVSENSVKIVFGKQDVSITVIFAITEDYPQGSISFYSEEKETLHGFVSTGILLDACRSAFPLINEHLSSMTTTSSNQPQTPFNTADAKNNNTGYNNNKNTNHNNFQSVLGSFENPISIDEEDDENEEEQRVDEDSSTSTTAANKNLQKVDVPPSQTNNDDDDDDEAEEGEYQFLTSSQPSMDDYFYDDGQQEKTANHHNSFSSSVVTEVAVTQYAHEVEVSVSVPFENQDVLDDKGDPSVEYRQEQQMQLVLDPSQKIFERALEKKRDFLKIARAINRDIADELEGLFDKMCNLDNGDGATRRTRNIAAPLSALAVVESFRIRIGIDISDLITEKIAEVFGINSEVPLEVLLNFERGSDYTKSSKAPKVEVTQKKVVTTKDFVTQKSKFETKSLPCRFGNQIQQMLTTYFAECWDRDGRGFVAPTKKSIEDTIAAKEREHRDMIEQQRKQQYHEQHIESSTMERLVEKYRRRHADSLFKKFYPYDPLQGFFVHIVEWIRHRITTAAEFCVICDQTHAAGFTTGEHDDNDDANGGGDENSGSSAKYQLVPCCCERALCVHQFQNLRIGKDATDSIATSAGTLDLLVGMFRAAVTLSHESRRAHSLSPFPSITDDTGHLVLGPSKQNHNLLIQLTNELPRSKDLIGIDTPEKLSNLFKGKDPNVYRLLNWIVSSNRSYFKKLPVNHRLQMIHTEHQFLLVTASEEKQRKFEALKKAVAEKDKLDGSATVFGWHGSGSQNWHSILRNGLKNMSNTTGMTAGAVYGSGVYFAYLLSTSFQYSGLQFNGNSATGTTSSSSSGTTGGGGGSALNCFDSANGFTCVALCEIVADKVIKNQSGWCFTVQNEDAILTRFLFVYTNASDANKDMNIGCQDSKFRAAAAELVAKTH